MLRYIIVSMIITVFIKKLKNDSYLDCADFSLSHTIAKGRHKFMKRSIFCIVLMASLAIPALATAEVQGVYIAPRFLLGIQDTGLLSRNGVRDDDGREMFNQHSRAVFGGALAVGFNFAQKFNVPLRTEIEFALRSNSSNSKDGEP